MKPITKAVLEKASLVAYYIDSLTKIENKPIYYINSILQNQDDFVCMDARCNE